MDAKLSGTCIGRGVGRRTGCSTLRRNCALSLCRSGSCRTWRQCGTPPRSPASARYHHPSAIASAYGRGRGAGESTQRVLRRNFRADTSGLSSGFRAQVPACHRLCEKCARCMAPGSERSGSQPRALTSSGVSPDPRKLERQYIQFRLDSVTWAFLDASPRRPELTHYPATVSSSSSCCFWYRLA